MSSPIKIDVPLGAGVRAGCGCASVLVLAGAVTAAVAAFAGAGAGDTDPLQTALELVLFLVVPIALVAVGWMVLRRGSGAWIEGSVLEWRVAFRSRKVDLSRTEAVYYDTRVHLLVVKDVFTGTLRVPLVTGRGPLPSAQLRALADGLAADRRHDQVAAEIRALAERSPR
ncbi:hypothetical protein [Nonomuraea longicatena]|uniref:PH domain-containing protein n=1 Tax=Nonomuraea longicatena TaxID=83682 RepID=A0ABP3Z1U3_9ACTN